MRTIAAYGLLALGLLRMAGGATGIEALRDVGAASAASPAPQAFTTVRGIESFSTRVELAWYDLDGTEQSIALTREILSGIPGPGDRRALYGALLTDGPILATEPRTGEMFEQIARFALCGFAPVLLELGLDPLRIGDPIAIRSTPRPGSDMGDLPRSLTVSCR